MSIKTILVANNHLNSVGGSETFTYAMIESLISKGYNVEYFTFSKGITSDKIEHDLGVKFMSKSRYDLILANHHPCVKFLSIKGITIQTCHGIFPKLEYPSKFSDGYVSISEEIKQHIYKSGFKSELILNGINCERYTPISPLNHKLSSVLSLSQSSLANKKIEEACIKLGVKFIKLNKFVNPIWNVENLINEADLVIGLGRSAYEAMACGRATVVYDQREYNSSKADGYMIPEHVSECVLNNCSGRYRNLEYQVEDLINCFNLYNPKDGADLREHALKCFNIKHATEQYITYAETLKKRHGFMVLQLIHCYQFLKQVKQKYKFKRRAKRANPRQD
tara:strand:- start:3339 stop:4346 length:1008 start_codon:yes stop_codon:yes gene_type:complete